MPHRAPSVTTSPHPAHVTHAALHDRETKQESITFSIVIPTYNRRALLALCLESVFQQQYQQYEVIVVDDGSTDGTARLLESLGSRVRVFRQENRGPGAARNLGISHAQGDYVAFLDSDDIWFPWTLQVYEEAIRMHGTPALISGVPLYFRDPEELASVVFNKPPVTNMLKNFYSGSDCWRFPATGLWVVRVDHLDDTRSFEPDRMNSEDLDFVMKLGASEGYVEIQHPVTLGYRTHEHQVSLDSELNHGGMSHLIDQERRQQYPGGTEWSLQRKEIITRGVRSLSLACARKGHMRQAWTLYLKTFLWHLRLMRIRYLIGFPLTTLLTCVVPRNPDPETNV